MSSYRQEPEVSAAAVEAANRREYDRGVDPLLVLIVYEPLHGGWYLTSLAGRRALEDVARQVAPGARVLEIGSGLGDGCRYLAARRACRITGIELNARQLEIARARRRADPVAESIEYVEGDFLRWTPPAPFDVVFAVDTLMMFPDVGAALAAACRALAPGGRLVLHEICGGDAITDEARRYGWDEGAILSLPRRDEYEAMLGAAGFDAIDCTDLTAHAIATLSAMRRASLHRSAEVVAVAGEEGLSNWLELTVRYAGYFESDAYAYLRWTARRAE